MQSLLKSYQRWTILKLCFSPFKSFQLLCNDRNLIVITPLFLYVIPNKKCLNIYMFISFYTSMNWLLHFIYLLWLYNKYQRYFWWGNSLWFIASDKAPQMFIALTLSVAVFVDKKAYILFWLKLLFYSKQCFQCYFCFYGYV